jgi:hypothetical protein
VARRLLPDVITRFWILWTLWALWGVAIVWAAAHDSVLLLPNLGHHPRGLLQHFGFQAIFLSGPVLVVGTYYVRRDFIRSLQRLLERQPTYEKSATFRSEILSLAGPISLWSVWGRCLGFLCLIGGTFSFVRLRELSNPVLFWGNDVFNASEYYASYIVTNSFLSVLWCAVYPIVALQIIHTTVMALFIVPKSISNRALRLDLLHPDGHAGMTGLAKINAYITTLYAVPAVVFSLLYMTHDRVYFPPKLAVLLLTVVFLAHTIAGLGSVAYSISLERDRAVALWNEKIKHLIVKKRLGSTEALVALKYRDCLLSISLFPFKKTAIFAASLLGLTLSAAVVYFEWVAK